MYIYCVDNMYGCESTCCFINNLKNLVPTRILLEMTYIGLACSLLHPFVYSVCILFNFISLFKYLLCTVNISIINNKIFLKLKLSD